MAREMIGDHLLRKGLQVRVLSLPLEKIMDQLNNKAMLLVDVMNFDGKTWTVRIHLYDESTHITKMSRWNVEAIEGDPHKRGWVTVDFLGQVNDKVAIVLPEVIQEMGTNISVHSKWISKPRRPIVQIMHEALAKNKQA